MQITVVIPTYQRPQLLSKCLKALQQQLLRKEDFEVIVVSDGPDATTREAADTAASLINIRYLFLPEKKGPAAARNMGWLNARSPVIAFTDDDCLPDPNWLKEILAAVIKGKAEVFTGRVIVPKRERPTDHELNTAGLETADFVTANCACTKLALLAVGGFDERFSMAWREDSDLEFKFIQQGIPIAKLDLAKVIHPVRKAKWGISIKEQKKTIYNALLYRKYPELYRKKIQRSPPVLYYLIIATFMVFVLGLIIDQKTFTSLGGLSWLAFTTYFLYKRLSRTSLEGKHVLEMAFTSLLIPFLSIFWQWYGAVKYKVLFI